MKIMTFNTQHCLNYVEKKIDFEIMARAIIECEADVVGLNEMYGYDKGASAELTAQAETLAELTGLRYCYFARAIRLPNEGPYGNAILSKIPIIKAETILIPDPSPRGYEGYYETRCLLRAELENGITVIVSHFGLNPDEQENAVEAVIKSLSSERCILMGDFNVEPDSPILTPIREQMTDTADAFLSKKLSFPSDKPYCKIDYIFVSRDIEVLSADIPPIVASDHRPHIAHIKI